MILRAGTSGYAHKEWKGAFYPEDMNEAEMLSFYASKLGTVEINNTFYRMPKPELLRGWGEKVPPGFSFVIKASQRITHHQKLEGSGDNLGYLWQTVQILGAALGPVLFQLPPFLKKNVALLRDFLAILPEGCRPAFEFREASWFDDEVYAALAERNAALVG